MFHTNKQYVPVPVLVENIDHLPIYATVGAAGADIMAYLPDAPVILEPGRSALIPTGIRVAIPEGFEIQIRPRSGLALHHQLTILNTPGTIDEDYRGEIKIIMINHGTQPFTICHRIRIAQLILAPVTRAHFIVSSELAQTERGIGGFGHTGQI